MKNTGIEEDQAAITNIYRETLPIIVAIIELGPLKVARACGVGYQAVYGWRLRRSLPRTDWTGETNYAQAISDLSNGRYTIEELRRPDRIPTIAGYKSMC